MIRIDPTDRNPSRMILRLLGIARYPILTPALRLSDTKDIFPSRFIRYDRYDRSLYFRISDIGVIYEWGRDTSRADYPTHSIPPAEGGSQSSFG